MADDVKDDELLEGDAGKDGGGEVDPVAHLKEALAKSEREKGAEAAARQEAERRAAQAGQEVAKARQERDGVTTVAYQSRIDHTIASIDAVTQKAEAAQRAYKDAAERGDYEGLAKAQREISRAEAQLLQLEGVKSNLELQVAQQSQQPQRRDQPQQPTQSSDPIERYVAQLTPMSAAWVRAHPQVLVRNPDGSVAASKKLIHVHGYATEVKGLAVDSPDYFAFIESQMGIKAASSMQQTDTGDDPISDAGKVVELAPRRPAPSAPPSRDPPTADGVGRMPSRVKLTAEQLEAAEISGITPEEYARSLYHPATQEALKRGR